MSETGQELMCKHSKDGMPANSTERLPHAETQWATIQVGRKVIASRECYPYKCDVSSYCLGGLIIA